jgi:hypothetical protein
METSKRFTRTEFCRRWIAANSTAKERKTIVQAEQHFCKLIEQGVIEEVGPIGIAKEVIMYTILKW